MSVVVVILMTLQMALAVPDTNDCYSCESGAHESYQHTTCPVNGEVNGWVADSPMTCTGPCVTVLQTYPFANVARACASRYYYGEGFTIPTSGNVTIGSSFYVFCEGDGCNNVDLTYEQCVLIPTCNPPVDGGWSAWSEWGTCTVTCGNGTEERTRTCDNPAPEYEGAECVGDEAETQVCALDRCWENCYSCSSSAPTASWQNENCRADGIALTDDASNFISCQGPCVTIVRRWELGVVQRACSSVGYWNGATPPDSGCMADGERIACFCSGPSCNNDDRTTEQAEQLAKYSK